MELWSPKLTDSLQGFQQCSCLWIFVQCHNRLWWTLDTLYYVEAHQLLEQGWGNTGRIGWK